MLPRTGRWSPQPPSRSAASTPPVSSQPLARSPSPAPAPGTSCPSAAVPQTTKASGSRGVVRPFGADVTNTHRRSLTPPPTKAARVEPAPPSLHDTLLAQPYEPQQPRLCQPAEPLALDDATTVRRISGDSLESVSPILALQREEEDATQWSWYTPCAPTRTEDAPRAVSWNWTHVLMEDSESGNASMNGGYIADVSTSSHALHDVICADALELLHAPVRAAHDELKDMGFQPSL